jgi:hypothetical protein
MELLLAELQVQAATVTRAMQRVDTARSKMSDVQEGIRWGKESVGKVAENPIFGEFLRISNEKQTYGDRSDVG